MTLTALLTLAAAAAPSAKGAPAIEWHAPASLVQGIPYEVTLDIRAPADGGKIESWVLTPAAFDLGGAPLGPRKEGGAIELAPGTSLSIKLDLGPQIAAAPSAGESFQLECKVPGAQGGAMQVSNLGKAAPKGLDFMTMPVGDLGNYMVLLSTNRGDMLCEMWPDVAPNHVRNFLDLAYTGFYDGTPFHRVIPGFMIQGGDPTGTGTGSGKRTLKAEFSDKKHVRGVLSMARSQSPDSASCQFFVMHGTATHLDGQYSAFGKLKSGDDVVDKIVNTPRSQPGDKPNQPQLIQRATVIAKANTP